VIIRDEIPEEFSELKYLLRKEQKES